MSNICLICVLHCVIFLKGSNKLEVDKKGFDNLANNEQGEQQKKEKEETQDLGQNQEKANTLEKTTSCEHPDQGAEAEGKENQEKDGIMAEYRCYYNLIFLKTLKKTLLSLSTSANQFHCVRT